MNEEISNQPMGNRSLRLDSQAEGIKETPAQNPLIQGLSGPAPNVTPFNAKEEKQFKFESSATPRSVRSATKTNIVPYEKYHRNGNVSMQLLKLPKTDGFLSEFPKYFAILMFFLFPVGILLAYLSSLTDKDAFTFVSLWLLIIFFTLAILQYIVGYKNGLATYILQKQEFDKWDERLFNISIYIGTAVLAVINLALAIYFGFISADNQISNSVISIFLMLSILMLIDTVIILFTVYFIVPASSKLQLLIKERINRLVKLQQHQQIPFAYQFINQLLVIHHHGHEGNAYQSLVASQNYQKFLTELDQRQWQLLAIAKSRNDRLTHEANKFITQLSRNLKDKKEEELHQVKYTNPGLSPFEVLLMLISYYLQTCIYYACLLYFALFYQNVSSDILPLLFFGFELGIFVVRHLSLSLFTLKQFYDYQNEGKLIMLSVSAYRIGAFSVQSLETQYFVQLLLIKFACKFLNYWIYMFGYYTYMDRQREQILNYIKGSTIFDTNQKENRLDTQPTQSNLLSKRTSVYQAQSSEVPTQKKNNINQVLAEQIEGIKKTLVMKYLYRLVITEVIEVIYCLLFLILSSILYTESPQTIWSSFTMSESQHNQFQLEIGIELLFEVLFFGLTLFLYQGTKYIQYIPTLSSIIGMDGLKSLIYDYGFALVMTFLIVANRFQIQ